MVYRQLPAWQTRIACRGIPTNSNLTVAAANREGPMVYRLLPAWQARIARRGIPANSNLSFPSGEAALPPS